MRMLWFSLFLLACATVISAKGSKIKVNGTCIFSEVSRCYEMATGFGGNVTAIFRNNNASINDFCQNDYHTFTACLSAIATKCEAKNLQFDKVTALVSNICSNIKERERFLNFTVTCFNYHVAEAVRCVRDNSPGKNDTKSMCKLNKDSTKCIMAGLQGKCYQNATDYRRQLFDIYNTYIPYVCSGAATITTSGMLWMVCFYFITRLFLEKKVV